MSTVETDSLNELRTVGTVSIQIPAYLRHCCSFPYPSQFPIYSHVTVSRLALWDYINFIAEWLSVFKSSLCNSANG